ncbi:MAG: hypothetical protein M0R00_06730 [Candidatus Omnitrophica bacterium]|jgi:hypothetical protein|nr:hypothetical protein [Candidatus Omnitrophota bacterium]
MGENMKEPILCYIDGPWAYFTTQSLKKQWGDDWDDAPYECNAGPPYGPEEGDKPWEIIKIAWDGDFEQPNIHSPRTEWSVKNINQKCVPWLASASFMDRRICIWAGTKLPVFKKLIKKGGGDVYIKANGDEP